VAEQTHLLRVHGAKPKYYHQFVGGNFRMDPMQAALLRVKVPHYATYTRKRQNNAAFYTEKLAKVSGAFLPEDCECGKGSSLEIPSGARLILPIAHHGNEHIWNQYTLRVVGQGKRDALKEFLSERGIGSEIYYPVPMHRQPCFRYLGHENDSLPNAMRLAEEALSIPIYPELASTQLEDVTTAISAFLRNN